MGKVSVSKNLKRRRTTIDSHGNVLDREGFGDEDKVSQLKQKQRERAERLGLKPKE